MRRLVLVCFLLFASLDIFSAPSQLKKTHLRSTMEDMLSYHVEHKELSNLLVRRSIKIYIEQFDPQKVYLLNSEVLPFLEVPQDTLREVGLKYQRDDLSFYISLNKVIQKATERARALREEMIREFILAPPDIEQHVGGSYLGFASNEQELKQRLRKQLISFLINAEQATLKASPSKREKVFSLLEKRLKRNEDTYFYDGKNEHYIVLHALKALAKSLDSHTAYFSPEEAIEMRTNLEKQFEGIGVVLKEGVEGITITDLIKGGPAEKSGKILIGDVLVSIDKKPLEKVSYEEALALLKGDGKSEIALGLKRKGSKAKILVRLNREKILMQEERLQYTSEPFADGIIGKINLPSFYEGGEDSSCEKDMKEAIRSLKKQGKLYGLVLDLRENSGGFLNQAVKVAGLFITSGVIVISKYSEGEVQYLRTIDGRSYFNGALVVLTSKASASAAEIVAQALQDYGAALIVGDERTYGKGTIQYQTVTDETASAFFKVTVGKYYTVSGKSTQIEGVKADLIVPTEYAKYNIGERFLEYPLSNDKMPPAFTDPLTDVDDSSRLWLQKNYLPQIQQRGTALYANLASLRRNSANRLANDKNFQYFLESLEPPKEGKTFSLTQNKGSSDLQMDEAVNILKDIVYLNTLR